MKIPFLGRKHELKILENEFNNLSGSRFVYVEANSGFGKTRLIQEFYNNLSSKSEYWSPVEITDWVKNSEIKTDRRGLELEIDCLFLHTRALENNGSLESYGFCFERIRHQFSVHMASVLKMMHRRSASKKLFRSAYGFMLNFALPGSSDIIDLINSTKEFITESNDAAEIVKNIKERYFGDSDTLSGSYRHQVNDVSKATIDAFKFMFKSNREFKVVIVVDDIHWIDEFSLDILLTLYKAATENNWNIMFLLCGWTPSAQTADSTNRHYEQLREYMDTTSYGHIKLDSIRKNEMYQFIEERLPGFGYADAGILISRSHGDLDLLNDFINQIIETPGWLDSDNKLLASRSELSSMPSDKIEIAKRALRNYPAEIKKILYNCALQGMVFDETFLKHFMELTDEDLDLTSLLLCTDTRYGLTHINESDVLRHKGEFRRVTFYDACHDLISKSPAISKLKKMLLAVVSNFMDSEDWSRLSYEDQWRYVELMDILCSEIDVTDEELLLKRYESLYSVASQKLFMGDWKSAVRLGIRISNESQSVRLKNLAYSLVADGYYYGGKADDEERNFVTWSNMGGCDKFMYVLKYAKYLRRMSKSSLALELLSSIEGSITDDRLRLSVEIEKLKTLWSKGDVKDVFKTICDIENKGIARIAESPLKIDYMISAYLISHDLEKNRLASIFAKDSIDYYEGVCNHVQQNIYKINYADALWGLGYREKAAGILNETIDYARESFQPQVLDIALICCANVLAESGDSARALTLYEEGINVASSIHHDWDLYYAKVYRRLLYIESGHGCGDEPVGVCGEYTALKELDKLLDLYCAYLKGNTVSSDVEFSIPVAVLNYRAILYKQSGTVENLTAFAMALSQVEGVKFNRRFLLNVVEDILKDNNIPEEIQAQLSLWNDIYNPKIEDLSGVRVRHCDYKKCQAMCCYDGVYLQDGEAEVIQNVVEANPEYFSFVPEEYIVPGNWNGTVSGQKTAVRAHAYTRFDYPAFFNKTRCVFAKEDGSCSLQSFAMENHLPPYSFKPLACQVFPLETKNGRFLTPCRSCDKGKYFIGLSYPGYDNYTPCGINCISGEEWKNVLEQEISIYKSYISDKDADS